MKTLWKTVIALTFISALVMAGPTVCFAKMGKEMKHHMKATEKQMMHGMPMKGMMGKSMAATQDGGVVVMVCNKLYKFDADLNLKKEAEIPFDEAHMEKMMERMKKMQSRMGQESSQSDMNESQSR